MTSSSGYSLPLRLLLIEDDANDAELIQEAFGQAGLRATLERLPDTESAVRYFHRVEAGQAPVPDLVIMDLGLPGEHGLQAIKYIKTSARLRAVPVLVFSGSQSESDVWASYQAYANAYVVKPARLEEFRATLRHMAEFYLRVVLLPPQQ